MLWQLLHERKKTSDRGKRGEGGKWKNLPRVGLEKKRTINLGRGKIPETQPGCHS